MKESNSAIRIINVKKINGYILNQFTNFIIKQFYLIQMYYHQQQKK
jgi:hypothetical protein